MFETVIVAALRNKTDRFVQLDSSANTCTVAVFGRLFVDYGCATGP